jgi:predicted PurR-regulated permease PerM
MKGNVSITQLIRIVLLLLFLAWCFFIIKPFVLIILWAAIIAIALFPIYDRLVLKIGVARKKMVTVVFTLIATTLVLVPGYLLTSSVMASTMETANKIRTDTFQIPKPDPSVKEWPIIGVQLFDNWSEASKNIKKYSSKHKDVILDQGSTLFSGFKGFVGALVVFASAFLIAVVFMYYSDKGYSTVQLFSSKILGKDGDEMMLMSRDTVRSLVKGILLVALIQASLSFIGFKAIGIPAAGIFTFLVLVAAIIQLPVIIILIPAILLAFSISETTPAIIFTIYCLLIGISDNILKPLLLGKELKTPIIIILVGSIGGMLLHGIIGLFIGAVVLAVMHRMYNYWVNSEDLA